MGFVFGDFQHSAEGLGEIATVAVEQVVLVPTILTHEAFDLALDLFLRSETCAVCGSPNKNYRGRAGVASFSNLQHRISATFSYN